MLHMQCVYSYFFHKNPMDNFKAANPPHHGFLAPPSTLRPIFNNLHARCGWFLFHLKKTLNLVALIGHTRPTPLHTSFNLHSCRFLENAKQHHPTCSSHVFSFFRLQKRATHQSGALRKGIGRMCTCFASSGPNQLEMETALQRVHGLLSFSPDGLQTRFAASSCSKKLKT